MWLDFPTMRHTFFLRASAGVCEKVSLFSSSQSPSQPYQERCSLVLAFDLNCLPSLRAGVFVGVVRLAKIQYSIS